jgi:cell division protein FtsI/penicillin-binding protein 2
MRYLTPLVLLGMLAACGNGPIIGPSSTSTSSLPTAQVLITRVPSADSAMRAYLDAMLAEDTTSMYSLLTQASQAAISQEDFSKRYSEDLNALSVKSMDYNILSMLTDPQTSQVSFHMNYQTALFGNLGRDINCNLKIENGAWRIEWDDGLILPELAGGKSLTAISSNPARGDIYDRNGNAIVIETDAVALGLVSGEVNPDSETAVFYKLELLTGVRREVIRNNYNNYAPGNYVPVGEASLEAVQASGIAGYSGVQTSEYQSRFYEPNIAPNAIGYTLFISEDEYNAYRRLGYNGSERVGWEGIEKWGEEYLHGRNETTLYITAPDGTYETVLAQVNSEPAASITLTIDNDLQKQAQAAMDGLPGAVVVMEVNTGRVLAMVSSPGFDPNWYDLNNVNRQFMDEQPTFNRATQGAYPLGSVFKIITMAAGLESGLFTPQSTLDCQYTFTDLVSTGGPTLYDWTWERCQTEKANNGTDKCPSWPPSGMLNISQGLMRSCDPWFYHIGFSLYSNDQANAISDMARAFGLGSATGIEQVAEAKGNIPNPTDGTNATSIAIGQGDVLVTPLQVAAFMAAIANGGTLYRPQLVEEVQPAIGEAISIFKPQSNSTLPVSTANLRTIQEAMRSVITDKRGTAYSRFVGFPFPLAAKTGTAESGVADPHAWFAGYSLAGNPNKPDIALAVLVNNQGEGSIWAAPIFRRVMEIYYFGKPQTTYPWEKSMGVVDPDYNPFKPKATPTPGP